MLIEKELKLEKKYPKVEFKILPHNFEKTLNSTDKTVSGAYKKLRKKDFPGWLTMGEIEQDWRSSQPKTNSLEIFPEAKPYLRYKLKNLEEKSAKLSQEIYFDFLRIAKKYNGFTLWFFKEMVKTFKGEELDKMIKQISVIRWSLFSPKAKKQKGGVTKQEIEKAKERDFEDFIEVKNHFALCPNHNDHHPSLYIKNRYCYCFACGYSADIIKFIQDTKGFSFMEAVRYLI